MSRNKKEFPNKAFIMDFEDSFTLNIFCELREIGVESEVVPFKEVKDFLECHVNSKERLGIVLGPGPGHPREYSQIVGVLERILKRENLFILGVCLGHQLIGEALGMKIKKSKNPKHGEVERIPLDAAWKRLLGKRQKEIMVQRYNSLAFPEGPNRGLLKSKKTLSLFFDGELAAMRGNNFLTYQFHPESVGTSFRSSFFEPLRSFLL